MEKVIARPLERGSVIGRGSEILRIEYSLGGMTVYVRDVEGNGFAVVFEDVRGYRVLDERNLAEYWPECSEPNGRIFEVESGGWLDQERRRPLFLEFELIADLKEFLVAGIEDCVSVLCVEPPEVCRHAL